MTPGMRMQLFILISHLYMHPRQIFNTKLQSFIKGKKGKIISKSLKVKLEYNYVYSVWLLLTEKPLVQSQDIISVALYIIFETLSNILS